MDAVIANATFSDATCADSSTSLVVTIDFEISMPRPRFIQTAGVDSVLARVTTVLETAVSDGSLTTAIQSFATRRRRLDADDKRVEALPERRAGAST